jgi:5-oxoprolinase (ATP-hydrolysing)
VFNNLFMNIAEQIPAAAEHGPSVNINGAAGLLLRPVDAEGNLIANAPYMLAPGQHGESIKTVTARTARPCSRATSTCSPIRITGHASAGHVITRSFHDPAQPPFMSAPRANNAARRHHAGLMPPFSTRIEEEGVEINNFKPGRTAACRVRRDGQPRRARSIPRATEQNMATWRQTPPTRAGTGKTSTSSLDVLQAHMRHVQDNADRWPVITRSLRRRFTLPLDNGRRST